MNSDMRGGLTIGAITVALCATTLGADAGPSSLAYVLQADALAPSRPQAVERLAACGRDWIVLDATYSTDMPWTTADLNAIRSGRPGRRIIAYISIGEAEDYRPYWRKEWGRGNKLTSAAPPWLQVENPNWRGNYRVKYWHPEWQRLILAAVDDAMAGGFDGVYFDIVDGFESFEQYGEDFIDNRLNLETRQTYRRDMVEWVQRVAARARANHPAALVIPQNGSQLLTHADFLSAIDAIGIEDLFTDGNRLQPRSHSREVLGHLAILQAANKPVLLIEYPKNAERQAAVKQQASENRLVWLITDRQLKTLGESGK